MAHYAHEAVRPRPPRALPERIGYQLPVADASQWAAMTNYLVGRGLSHQLASANDWYPSTSAGDAFPRVVIPAHGNLTTGFWQARAMAPVEPRWQSPHGPRGDAVVVVFPRAVAGPAVVVEGPMCALAAAEMGCYAIALLGATPPYVAMAYVIERLLGFASIVVVADRDRPDLAARWVAPLSNAGPTRLVVPTLAKDLAEHTPEQRRSLLA